jgi:hypothetical protein
MHDLPGAALLAEDQLERVQTPAFPPSVFVPVM